MTWKTKIVAMVLAGGTLAVLALTSGADFFGF